MKRFDEHVTNGFVVSDGEIAQGDGRHDHPTVQFHAETIGLNPILGNLIRERKKITNILDPHAEFRQSAPPRKSRTV
jgi:hypothetical protein